MSLEKLTTELFNRQQYLRADRNQYTVCLKDKSAVWLVLQAFPHVIKGLERRATLVDLSVTIGRRIRAKLGLKQDSIASCQVGFFVLISFFEVGLLSYKLARVEKKSGRKSQYRTYEVHVKNRLGLFELWEAIKEEDEVDLYPTNKPPEPWTSGFHPTGATLVKKGELALLKQLKPESQPIVFRAVNKAQSTPWVVNRHVLSVVEHYMEAPDEGNPLSFKQEKDPEKRQSKWIIADACIRIAKKHLDKPMYGLYNLDFRSRVYNATAFLQPQGDDLAKGLLLLERGEVLGDEGLYWLLLHTANTFGYDKDTLDNRVQWAHGLWETIVQCGREPLVHEFWKEAEDPWSFLSCCIEISMLQDWVDSGGIAEEFISNLVCYIDGSVNGSQHLTALSKDDELAPYTSLVKTELPGDLYTYVGQKVWDRLEYEEAKLPAVIYDRFDEVFNELIRLQEAYDKAEKGSELKSQAWEAIQHYRNNNRKLREWLFPVYWRKIDDVKMIRKLVKRNVMTIGYGATVHGMGQQIWDDSRELSEYLSHQEKLWSSQLGRLVHTTAREDLVGPGQMLKLFETLAERSNARQEPLAWTTPITNFPVIQNYRKALTNRTLMKHGGEELKVIVETWDEAVIDKDSQKLGASPNIVHSLDATHLMMIIDDCPFDIAPIHDSYGCVAGNMSFLFRKTRETFVELYKADPLRHILEQLDALDLMPERGSYNVESIMESDFAFC